MKATILTTSLLALTTIFTVGCEGSTTTQTSIKKSQVDDHSRWWCDEHGIPEEECSICNARVAADYRKKGDWCAQHDRARSQCFKCEPSLKEKFTARYRAKYGKEPPSIKDGASEGPGEKS